MLSKPNDSEKVIETKILHKSKLKLMAAELEEIYSFWEANPGTKYYCPVKTKLSEARVWLNKAVKEINKLHG